MKILEKNFRKKIFFKNFSKKKFFLRFYGFLLGALGAFWHGGPLGTILIILDHFLVENGQKWAFWEVFMGV